MDGPGRTEMMKLATMFAIAALAGVGCGGGKKDDNKTATAQPKPVEPKPDDKAAKPDDKAAKPDDKAPAAGDLPAECGEWKDAIAKLESCQKLSQQSREALKQAYDAASTGWSNLPADGKAGVAQACKAGVDAVKQAAAACEK
jgi:hypothetical protein